MVISLSSIGIFHSLTNSVSICMAPCATGIDEMLTGDCRAYLLAYCSILEWVSSWESWGVWDSLENEWSNGDGWDSACSHGLVKTENHEHMHTQAFTHSQPNGPTQLHLETNQMILQREKYESGMIYGAFGCFLTGWRGWDTVF